MTTSSTPTGRPTLCVAVLTLNEAARIERCLRSATFADQWLVADSGSTDDTCQRAAALGADVHVFADWQGFAQQRNRLLPFIRTDYVLWLDADEVIPDSLRDEILALLQTRPEPFVGRIAWLEHAFGRPLTHFQRRGLPRLFPVAELVGFEGVVHEGPLLKRRLPVVELRAPLHHHSRETVYDSLRKLAQYTQLGAAKRAQRGQRGGVLRGLASASAMFIRLYVFRRGFTGGGAGFLFCLLIALECLFRYAALAYDRDHLETLAKR
nr:glycosyltransferase family 2 protein [Tepidimonas sediminis]